MPQVGGIVSRGGDRFVVADEDETGLFFLVPLFGVGVKAVAKSVEKAKIRKEKRAEVRAAREKAEAAKGELKAKAKVAKKAAAPSKKSVAAPPKTAGDFWGSGAVEVGRGPRGRGRRWGRRGRGWGGYGGVVDPFWGGPAYAIRDPYVSNDDDLDELERVLRRLRRRRGY